MRRGVSHLNSSAVHAGSDSAQIGSVQPGCFARYRSAASLKLACVAGWHGDGHVSGQQAVSNAAPATPPPAPLAH